jgi:predicted amidohydrolase YtcJ
VIGRNWDQSLWPGGAFPTAAVLDAAAPDRPVWLTRVDGHAGWANSEAMRRAKVDRDSKAPSDGQVIRDASGNPTGVFIDGAKDLITRIIPGPAQADTIRRLLAGQALALAAGLTGIHDAGVSRRDEAAYRALDREGRLKLRVYGMALPGDDVEDYVKRSPLPAKPAARFELRAIKLFIDGAMGSRGALLFEPYSDDAGNRGLLLIEPEVLERTTVAALRHGWQVCTHAIGDRGNALVLDAYATARAAVPEARDPRLRIEHAQVVRPADVARFASLGVIASMQPSHAIDDMRWAEARVGADRARGAYAWRWLVDAGVAMAFGSDAPVAVVNPLYGLYAALTRQDEKGSPAGGWLPDQRLRLDEALRAHTAGSAHAAFAEQSRGVLKPGMRADVTVVDRDLFAVEPRDLLEARVLMTVIDGEVVYERGGS